MFEKAGSSVDSLEALVHDKQSLSELLSRFPLPGAEEKPAILKLLRQENTEANLVATLASQWELRELLGKKIDCLPVEDFLLTRAGVEQATREIVARLHASYFRDYLDRTGLLYGNTGKENQNRYTIEHHCSPKIPLQSEGVMPNAGQSEPGQNDRDFSSSLVFVDLGCGLGFETIAFAQNNPEVPVLAYEIDPLTALYARHNLEKFPQVEVKLADGVQGKYQNYLLFSDPARRKNGKRIYDPQQWSPALDTVLELAKKALGVGVKIAPGILYSDIPANMHAQWVSVSGELVEAALWSDNLFGERPGRSGVILSKESSLDLENKAKTKPLSPELKQSLVYQLKDTLTLEKKIFPISPAEHYVAWTLTQQTNPQIAPEPMPPAPQPGRYLYELDSALLRAGLLAQVAKLYNLAPLSVSIAYLTDLTEDLPDGIKSSQNPDLTASSQLKQALEEFRSYALTAWKIKEILPLKAKSVSRYLAEHNITHVEIKKRGADIDPKTWRNKILPPKLVKQSLKNRRAAGLSPKQGITVFLTQLNGKHVAILAEAESS